MQYFNPRSSIASGSSSVLPRNRPIIVGESEDKKKLTLEFEKDYSIIEAVKTLPNRKWNADYLRWEVPNTYKSLVGLVRLFDSSKFSYILTQEVQKDYLAVLEEQKGKEEVQQEAMQAKKLIDVEMDLSQWLKREPFPYQRVAIHFLEKSNGIGGIFDPMGFGKTLNPIAYALKHDYKVLVVTLASCKINWQIEINDTAHSASSKIVKSGMELSRDERVDFTITNYEQWINRKNSKDSTTLDSLITLVREGYYDMVVLDEGQKIKNDKSKITQSILTNLINIPRRVILTGTGFKSRPIELWPLLYFLDPIHWNSKWEFAKKYCDLKKTHFGSKNKVVWDMTGASNLQGLNKAIQPYIIRRTTVPNQPISRSIPIILEMTDAQRKGYEDIEYDFMVNMPPDKPTALAELQKLQRYTCECKLESIYELIDAALDDEHKVVVFTGYRGIAKSVAEKYAGQSVLYTGEVTSQEERNRRLQQFKTDPDCRVFSATYHAGGTGLNGLQHASDIVFFIDEPWTPADRDQAIARVARTGQKNTVMVYFPQLRETVDIKKHDLLISKEGIFKEAFDGVKPEHKEQSADASILTDIIKYYEERRKELKLKKRRAIRASKAKEVEEKPKVIVRRKSKTNL